MEDFGKISLLNILIVVAYTIVFTTWRASDFFGMPIFLAFSVGAHCVTLTIISLYRFIRGERGIASSFLVSIGLVAITGAIACFGVYYFIS